MIIFHNASDPLVPVGQHSEPLADALDAQGIEHQPKRPYAWYADDWDGGGFHAFKPNGTADTKSRAQTRAWLIKYIPPTGA